MGVVLTVPSALEVAQRLMEGWFNELLHRL